MLGHKRRPIEGTDEVEPWLDWQIRTMRVAEQVANRFGINIEQKFHDLRKQWSEHVIRLGVQNRVPHMCKFSLLWRPLAWWREQQLFLDIGLVSLIPGTGATRVGMRMGLQSIGLFELWTVLGRVFSGCFRAGLAWFSAALALCFLVVFSLCLWLSFPFS